jgi:hypothetical protein
MSLLLLIMLLSVLPFPILAAIEIADQFKKPKGPRPSNASSSR